MIDTYRVYYKGDKILGALLESGIKTNAYIIGAEGFVEVKVPKGEILDLNNYCIKNSNVVLKGELVVEGPTEIPLDTERVTLKVKTDSVEEGCIAQLSTTRGSLSKLEVELVDGEAEVELIPIKETIEFIVKVEAKGLISVEKKMQIVPLMRR